MNENAKMLNQKTIGDFMKTFFVLVATAFSISAHAKLGEYTCAANNTTKKIRITLNENAYGRPSDESFLISSPGLFPEFVGFDFDLAECAYDGMYGNENLATGMHCEGQSIGGGYDYKTSFTFQTDEKLEDFRDYPGSFEALIVDGDTKYELKCE